MASKDSENADAPVNPMELPSAVIAQAEAAASNENEMSTLTVSDSLHNVPERHSTGVNASRYV